MVNQLKAKKFENILDIGVPTELLHRGEKRQNISTWEGKNLVSFAKMGEKEPVVQGGEETKKPRFIHPWGTNLKEVLMKPLTEANYPPLYGLCDYCGCTK